MEISKQQDLIPIIISDIESKRKIIDEYRSRFPSNVDTITLNAFEFFDIIDEFEITISQSLQCIQTLQAEICNLKENQQEQSFNKALSIQAPSTIQNDDSLNYQIESLVPQNTNGNNVSVITTLTNNTQVYHKPKGVASGVQKQNKLNFDYSNVKILSDRTYNLILGL